MKQLIYFSILIIAVTTVSFTHRPLTWVAIGDSITYLNEHPNETGNRITKGYLSRVTDKLSYVHYINQGHNGWTTGRIADSIERLGIPQADVYSILLGTNDWWRGDKLGQWEDYANGTGSKTIYGAFRIIIDKIRQLNKDATIILMTPMQRGDFVYVNDSKNNAYGSYKEKAGQTLEQVAGVILDIAEHEHFKVVDLYHDKKLSTPRAVQYKRLRDQQTGEYRNYKYPDYTSVPFNPAADEYPYPMDAIRMTYDGLHPSDKGNAEIAKRLGKVMKKVK